MADLEQIISRYVTAEKKSQQLKKESKDNNAELKVLKEQIIQGLRAFKNPECVVRQAGGSSIHLRVEDKIKKPALSSKLVLDEMRGYFGALGIGETTVGHFKEHLDNIRTRMSTSIPSLTKKVSSEVVATSSQQPPGGVSQTISELYT